MRFLVLFVILFVIEVIFIKIAKRFKLTDISRENNVDLDGTVQGGGIIFFFAALCYYVYYDFQYSTFILGLAILSVVSFVDDIKSLSISSRLFFQFLSVSLVLSQLGFHVPLSWIYISILIVSVGVINAYNFMDGINGMTGGYSSIVILALWFVNNYHIKFIDNDFLIFTLLGLMVFSYFNFRTKARCFAGDVGSISIAVIILFLLVKLIFKEQNLTYILFLSVYGVDSVLTIIHRLFLKENIFKAHRLHLFQVIVHNLKVPHLLMASIYMFIQSIICGIVIFNLRYSINIQLIASVGIMILLATLYVIMKRKVMALTV